MNDSLLTKSSRNGGSPRRILLIVSLFLLAVNAGFGLIVYLIETQPIYQDVDRAESFMKAIEVGNDDFDDADTSGYGAAYQLVHPDIKDDRDFPNFLDFFDEPVRKFGFIQSWHRQPREFGHFTARKIRFEVEYGGLGGDPTVVVYELTMTEYDDVYYVADYNLISTSKKSD